MVHLKTLGHKFLGYLQPWTWISQELLMPMVTFCHWLKPSLIVMVRTRCCFNRAILKCSWYGFRFASCFCCDDGDTKVFAVTHSCREVEIHFAGSQRIKVESGLKKSSLVNSRMWCSLAFHPGQMDVSRSFFGHLETTTFVDIDPWLRGAHY